MPGTIFPFICSQENWTSFYALVFVNVFCFVTGKKNKLRVYYLSWLRNKILHNDPEVEKKQGWTTVGELEGCVHYKVGTCCFKVPDLRNVAYQVLTVD